MKIAASICVLLLLITTPAGVAQFHLDVEKTLLPNGLTLLTCVDSAFPTVSYMTFIDAGSRDETQPGAAGAAYVLERMMFQGTEKYPDHGEAIAHMGPQSDAWTDRDYTCFYVNAKAEFLSEIIEVESDRVKNLVFTQEAFKRELGPIRDERRRAIDDDPEGYLYMELYRLAYRRHTYRHPVLGWEDDLKRTPAFEDVNVYRGVFYAPNYCTIVICGNFDPDQAAVCVFEHYGDWKGSLPPTSQVRAEPKQEKRLRNDLQWKDSRAAPRLLLAYKGPDLDFYTPDFVALQVLSGIMSSATGRICTKLVLETGMAERIQADFEGARDPALFIIDVTPAEGQDHDSVLSAMEQELHEIKRGGISDDEIVSAVNQIRSDLLFELDTPFGIGRCIGYYHLTGGDYRMMFTYYEMLGAITASDIQQAARDYLVSSNSTVITLTPLSED